MTFTLAAVIFFVGGGDKQIFHKTPARYMSTASMHTLDASGKVYNTFSPENFEMSMIYELRTFFLISYIVEMLSYGPFREIYNVRY